MERRHQPVLPVWVPFSLLSGWGKTDTDIVYYLLAILVAFLLLDKILGKR